MMGSIDNDLTKLTSILCENSMVSISPNTSRHESVVCPAVAFDLEKVTQYHNIMGHLNFSDCFKMLDMQLDPVPRCESYNCSTCPTLQTFSHAELQKELWVIVAHIENSQITRTKKLCARSSLAKSLRHSRTRRVCAVQNPCETLVTWRLP